MAIQISNNATTTLAVALSATGTTVVVASGTGALFPVLAKPGDYFPITVVSANYLIEIMKVTARNGDMFTVERAQENTSSRAFPVGCRVDLRMTAGSFREMIAEKLDKSGGTIDGNLTVTGTLRAKLVKSNGFDVWTKENFDPTTKLDTEGDQTLSADWFRLYGSFPRYILADKAGTAANIGLNQSGYLTVSTGETMEEPFLVVQTDGNIWTPLFGYLNDYTLKIANERAEWFADNRMWDLEKRINAGYVRSIRLGYAMGNPVAAAPGPGFVMTGWYGNGMNVLGWVGVYRPIQMLIGETWFTIGQDAS